MPDKKESKSTSRVISARLNSNDEEERHALEIIDKLLARGFSMRQILTDAILRADGRTPEMYRNSSDNVTKGYLEQSLEDFASYLLARLPSGQSASVESEQQLSPFDADDDEDLNSAQNLAAGFLARRNRGDS